ncbi:MAG: hypothetical protein Q9208_007566 [Pyrenodesmia sp. 3 TL-2023]
MNISAVVTPTRGEDAEFKYTVTFRSQDFTHVAHLREYEDSDSLEQPMQQLEAHEDCCKVLYRKLALGNRMPKGGADESLRVGWDRTMNRLSLKATTDWRVQIEELHEAIEIWMGKPKPPHMRWKREGDESWMELDCWQPDFMAFEFATEDTRGNYRLRD